ncbi:MAG: TolC family protein [Bdellovibrionota bacterium]
MKRIIEAKNRGRWMAVLLGSALMHSLPCFAQNSAQVPDTQAPLAPLSVDEETAPDVPSSASSVLDLPQILNRVLSVNPSMESTQKDLLISEAQFNQARNAAILPSVKLRALGGVVPDVPEGSGPESNFPPVDTGFWDLGPFFQTRIEGFQPLYTFGKIKHLKEAARRGVEIKEHGVELARNQLIFETKRAYYGLSFLHSMKAFIEELQGRGQKARDLVENMIKQHGTEVTDIDLMRIDLFLAETERRMVELNNNLAFSQMVLKILMAMPRDEEFEIKDKNIVSQTSVQRLKSVEEYLEDAKDHRPEIAQISSGIELRDHLFRQKRAEFFPDIALGGFYNFGIAPNRQDVRSPFLVDDFNNSSGGGSLVLSQNLSFHMTKSRMDQAKAEYEKALADQKRAFQGIEIEVRNAHMQALSKYQAVESSRRALKHGRSWVLASTLNFGTGIAPPKDLLEAFVAYSTVKATYFETVFSFYMALASMSKAVGQEVTQLEY